MRMNKDKADRVHALIEESGALVAAKDADWYDEYGDVTVDCGAAKVVISDWFTVRVVFGNTATETLRQMDNVRMALELARAIEEVA